MPYKKYALSLQNNMDYYTHLNNMKKTRFLLFIGLIAMVSCTSYKKVPYLQNSSEIDSATISVLHDMRIQPKDVLTITVSSEMPEAAVPFNLTVPTPMSASSKSLTSQPALQSYLVDNEGCIEYPTLGNLKVSGMTKGEVEEMIKEKIQSNFTTPPIVTVRMVSYKISVLGEVANPKVHTLTEEKINVFEALALSGDLTLFGKRDNVKLIRENADGTKELVSLNLNDANIVHSPYYNLQQNDILYVEPNKAKARGADISSMTSMWFSATSLLMAVVTFLLNLTNIK